MSVIMYIALNHLKLLFRDKNTFILLLALPLALTLIFGSMFGGGGGSGGITVVPLAVVDYDESEVSRYIGEVLDTDSTDIMYFEEDEAREKVENRDVSVALIIPAGFEQSLKEGSPSGLTLVKADLQESPGLAEEQVTEALYRLQANATVADMGVEISDEHWMELFESAEEKWHPFPAVKVELETVDLEREQTIPTGHRHSSPGFVVMFGMMTVITAGAGTIMQERENGTLARLLSAPLSMIQLFSGKMAGLMAGGIAQMAILIVAGAFLFNVEWGRNIPALILLVLALSFASTGFGMLLASVSRTRAQAETAGVMAVVLMSMLGGSWWPVELLPSYMQVMSKTIPSGWAMQGFTDLIMRGAGPAEVALPVLVMLAFGTGFAALGIILFKNTK